MEVQFAYKINEKFLKIASFEKLIVCKFEQCNKIVIFV